MAKQKNIFSFLSLCAVVFPVLVILFFPNFAAAQTKCTVNVALTDPNDIMGSGGIDRSQMKAGTYKFDVNFVYCDNLGVKGQLFIDDGKNPVQVQDLTLGHNSVDLVLKAGSNLAMAAKVVDNSGKVTFSQSLIPINVDAGSGTTQAGGGSGGVSGSPCVCGSARDEFNRVGCYQKDATGTSCIRITDDDANTKYDWSSGYPELKSSGSGTIPNPSNPSDPCKNSIPNPSNPSDPCNKGNQTTNPQTPAVNPGGTGTFETIKSPINIDSIGGLIVRVINYLIALVGAVAVLMIIVGGFRMVTAAGSESGVAAGKKAITWAIIGLLISLLAFTIVNLVQSLLKINTK